MHITLEIPDAIYASMLNGESRIPGSIGLTSPNEGNFNAYNRRKRTKPYTQTMNLPHGRVSVSEKDIRMSLCIERMEKVNPLLVIVGESTDACGFVDVVAGFSPQISTD